MVIICRCLIVWSLSLDPISKCMRTLIETRQLVRGQSVSSCCRLTIVLLHCFYMHQPVIQLLWTWANVLLTANIGWSIYPWCIYLLILCMSLDTDRSNPLISFGDVFYSELRRFCSGMVIKSLRCSRVFRLLWSCVYGFGKNSVGRRKCCVRHVIKRRPIRAKRL